MAVLGSDDFRFETNDFSTKVCRDGDESVTVILAGEFDLSTAADLRDCLERPDVLDAKRVTVDLTGVTFFDSTSTGLILSACKRIRSAGGAFSVDCANDLVLQVLQIGGLIEFLDVTAASALAPESGRGFSPPPKLRESRLARQGGRERPALVTSEGGAHE